MRFLEGWNGRADVFFFFRFHGGAPADHGRNIAGIYHRQSVITLGLAHPCLVMVFDVLGLARAGVPREAETYTPSRVMPCDGMPCLWCVRADCFWKVTYLLTTGPVRCVGVAAALVGRGMYMPDPSTGVGGRGGVAGSLACARHRGMVCGWVR